MHLNALLSTAVYAPETIGQADDVRDADGRAVFDFWQAQERAWHISKSLQPGGTYKVRDAVADYLTHLDGRASLLDTRLRLEAYALPALGDKHVTKLTADMLRNWHRGLASASRRIRGGTRSVNLKDPEMARRRKVSANRILGQLKAALNFAFQEGKVHSDIEWRRVKPFPKVNRSRASYLTMTQCRRLINAADPQFRLLVRAALETGCRYGELCRLRVEDFNADSGTVYIRQSKSGDARHVNLTSDGQAFFADLIAGRRGSEPMFRRQWNPSEQLRPMRAACERAKIDPPVGFHQLRHTWASLSVMNGVPLLVVAKSLGHADTRMVERHYGHLASSYIADTIRAKAPRFGKVSSNVRAL
jgi:integrase